MEESYPIGIQTFTEIVRTQSTYVDKTDLIYEMVKAENQKNIFFSRPRRFGKSLLLSTLKSIFEGEQHLFQGLFIYDKIAWKKHPIIHLSMTAIGFSDMGLEKALILEMRNMAQREEIALISEGLGNVLREFVVSLYEKYKTPVVLLIDEYDKPITEGLEINDSSEAKKNRDILKIFYAGLKDADPYIRFLFITGISKFAKVSIFSELNHLIDITLDHRFATLCGYTQSELVHYFPQGLQRLAQENNLTLEACLEKVKDWYNGFSWDGKHFVYNPFSTLLLLNSSQFENYWFASGTPTFLVKMLNANFDYQLTNLKAKSSDFDIFDLNNLPTKSLLLQTGYLTIKEKKESNLYIVDFPNKEVRQSFNEMLLGDYLHHTPGDAGISIYEIKEAFEENNLPQVLKIMQALFSSVPYELYEKKGKDGKVKSVGENFFHAVIYLLFNTLGVRMQAEVSVNEGRIDAVVETAQHIYLFEFKKNQHPDIALAQMKEKNYTAKYATSPKIIHLIGVSFSLRKRGLDKWKEEIIT